MDDVVYASFAFMNVCFNLYRQALGHPGCTRQGNMQLSDFKVTLAVNILINKLQLSS